jgi:hypothetical protein
MWNVHLNGIYSRIGVMGVCDHFSMRVHLLNKWGGVVECDLFASMRMVHGCRTFAMFYVYHLNNFLSSTLHAADH